MASFLGLGNYYRRLIAHFAEYAELLYKNLLELKVPSSEVLEMAFAKLKDELCDGVAVMLPNADKPFVVETYASIHVIVAVLLQREGEEEYPTHFYSQALNAPQRKYSTYERELVAVVKACDAFRVYLQCRELTLRTDHAALSAIFNSPLSSTGRVAKWLLAPQQFRFTVNYINGEENVAADKLSPIP